MFGIEKAYIIPCLNTEIRAEVETRAHVPFHAEMFTLGLLFIHWLSSHQKIAECTTEEWETVIGTSKLYLYNIELMTYHHILHCL